MRKWKVFLAISFLALFVLNQSVFAASKFVWETRKIEAIYNGQKINFPDQRPFLDSANRVQIPVRFVSEALGAKVGWSDDTKTVTIQQGNKRIVLVVGNKQATVNGKTVKFDTAAQYRKGRVFVPIRFVSEALGESVSWDPFSQYVWVGEKRVPNTDDDKFKLRTIDDFKAYYKDSEYLLENFVKEPYQGIKVIRRSDLPIQLGKGRVIYSIDVVRKDGEKYLAIRSSDSGLPIYFMVKNDYPKYRREVTVSTEWHSDGTVTSYYPEKSTQDVLVNGKFLDIDWKKFDMKTADYIGFRDDFPREYIVVMENPFK
jgi:hypothetical protein